MTIKILPARLANQIAAGEVVERPASVVKELVENSLDAGATRIDIDIEKGGAKLIRVRDNGKGIDKDELGLALSRHATSKIHSLDDLEAIMSLGFRGEALASISAVSRLTLTSRTATQEQAWSAHAEGRDMEVKLQPAAHPIGTSIEVLDLFFNTPARRKFLRTDKTEFTHIDELIKRIALSRFDVTIHLKHNGKIVRQYRAAQTDQQREKRVAAVCGAPFVRHMLAIELEHQGLRLHGWIITPQGARAQSDLQYCYVNGRMMRDKLINHAIRQSYETSLRPDQFAAYVLYIDVDPHQVDVNVHPAKHEVRFHQGRLVHDFIYQALADALAQGADIDKTELTQSAFHTPSPEQPQVVSDWSSEQQNPQANPVPERVYQAIEDSPAYPGKSTRNTNDAFEVREQSTSRSWNDSKPAFSSSAGKSSAPKERSVPASPSQSELRAYKQLLTTPESAKAEVVAQLSSQVSPSVVVHAEPIDKLGKAVCVVQEQYLVMADKQHCLLLSLPRAEWYRTRGQLAPLQQPLKSQPLLVPLAMKLEPSLIQVSEDIFELLTSFGIELKARGGNSLMVMGVPQPLRQHNLQNLIPDMLAFAAQNLASSISPRDELADWLAHQVVKTKSNYTLSEAIQLVAEAEQVWQGNLPFDDRSLVRPIDFTATIAALNYE
ncbi:DNA mismatch repair protein MutL [Vibrio xiamenensis]|uniref:DNA mismatch repair protein MutL n=1 Tax=Vibrio xiamenensis TaxID=861298 RepID=A0A1G8GPP4_9VIBR|nr:DNA mismatch repair endonuclease MutL [Vibrio xiamenensis]SDH96349.1 DNA mismatch repair protein MutL [Vibrio xiamenensis]